MIIIGELEVRIRTELLEHPLAALVPYLHKLITDARSKLPFASSRESVWASYKQQQVAASGTPDASVRGASEHSTIVYDEIEINEGHYLEMMDRLNNISAYIERRLPECTGTKEDLELAYQLVADQVPSHMTVRIPRFNQ